MEVMQVQQKETPTPYQGIQKLFPQIYSNPGQPNSWILVNVSRGIVYRGTVPTLELTFALMTEDGLEGATATYAFENISKSLILAHGDTGQIQCIQRANIETFSNQFLQILQIKLK